MVESLEMSEIAANQCSAMGADAISKNGTGLKRYAEKTYFALPFGREPYFNHILPFPSKGKRISTVFRTSLRKGNAFQPYFVLPFGRETHFNRISYFPSKGKGFSTVFRTSLRKGIIQKSKNQN